MKHMSERSAHPTVVYTGRLKDGIHVWGGI